MQGIYNDLLSALNGTSNTADAFVIVDDCVIVYDGYRTLRTCSFAFSAGDAAVSASLADHFIVFFCRRTWNKVGGISRDHTDQTLWTDVLFCAVAAAVTFFFVNDDLTVDQAHCMLLTDFDTGTDAYAAALALASRKAALYRFFAGSASGKAFLSGSSSVTSHERNCVLRC